jgi:predicted cupin superfamily sugar epimerase
LHRLDADEIFHYYLGDPCEQVVINPAGQLTASVLGPDVLGGHRVQTVVPKGSWQGTKLLEGGSWALVGTTMAPGYHPDGFELASMDALRELHADVAAMATSYLADRA